MSFQLNEFLQPEIEQKLSPVQKITCITTIADKNIIISALAYLGYSAPQFSLLFKLNFFFSLAIFSPEIHSGIEKKANQHFFVN